MWKLYYDEAIFDTYDNVGSRKFYISATHQRDRLGRTTHSITRYEIYEAWTTLESDCELGNGYYHTYGRDVPVLAFYSLEKARQYLELLIWVLNAPTTMSISKIISADLISISLDANRKLLEALEAESKIKRSDEIFPQKVLSEQCVYILEFEDTRSKVGITNDIERRIRQKEHDCGMECIRFCATDALSNAYDIEKRCLNHFSSLRAKKGEFFAAGSFDKIRCFLSTLSPIVFESHKKKNKLPVDDNEED